MAETRATAAVLYIRAGDIALKRGEHPGRDTMYLELGALVYVTLGLEPGAAAVEAAAMRRLAEVAAEAAGELERRAAADEDTGGSGDG